ILTGWGIWWGDAGDCVATCYMSGGTMELTGGPGIHEFGWGGASGKWIMTGGTVNAQGVVLSTGPGNTGELYLHGGTYNIGTSRAERSDRFGGGLQVNDGGLIDITEGTLVLDVLEGEEARYMQYLEDLMAAGQITAHGGAGVFAMDFDGRNPGKVTLTAVEAGKAYNPDPADGSVYEDTWASLSWSAAAGAVSHDVYVGEDFDQVSNGTGDTFRGNQGDTFYIVGFPGYPYPDGLVSGTTYYWRIDEVEEDGTTNRGDVWSFTVPPKTAFDPDPADGAESVDLDAELSWRPGFGAMLHTVYFGDNFNDVSNAAGGASQGPATYSPGQLEREKVYYWRVDEFDAVETHKGDVWAFSTPGAVGNPSPANGATGVQMNATLSWAAAESATSSEVYFGTDKDAVRNATSASPEYKGSKALGSESYDPGKLAWKSTYYWRVDGVSAADTVKGIVWSFETADFITVDDFESYTETEPDLIWNSWIDFFVNKTGVIIGYADPPSTEVDIVHGGNQAMPLFYENDGTVLDGTQFETKDTAFYAETQHEWTAPQDWTVDGVEVLSLWFHGNSSNDLEPMYVVLNGTAVVHHDDPAVVRIGEWTEWTINLQEFASQGVDLTNVNSIGIGFGDKNNVQAGGSGKMLFDDIVLYRPAAAPADPSLLGSWMFDEGSGATAGDSSGNGLDGAISGAVWASPGSNGMGSCLDFDGVETTLVDLGNFDVTTGDGLSISCWYKADNLDTPGNDPRLFSKAIGGSSQDHWFMLSSSRVGGDKVLRFRLKTDGDTGELKADTATGVIDLDVWTHAAAVWDGTTMKLYKNGVEVGSLDKGGTLSTNPDANVAIGNQPVGTPGRPWDGLIDDVRLYNRGLSEAEVAALANVQ
ncbi:MAG: LamG domain-containing protein, partial [Planctomycetota bacterium]